MKNVFINCSAKEFYEELKPLLLTLEGYTMYEDEWLPSSNGCRIDSNGDWYPFTLRVGYEEIHLADFIAAVKPKQPVDLRGRFIPCTEEQVDEVCDLLDALGCHTEGIIEPRVWAAHYTGVKILDTLSYLTHFSNINYPTLTLEELREIYKQAKQ